MKFDVLTLFPEMFEPIKQSIIGKAEEKKLIDIKGKQILLPAISEVIKQIDIEKRKITVHLLPGLI